MKQLLRQEALVAFKNDINNQIEILSILYWSRWEKALRLLALHGHFLVNSPGKAADTAVSSNTERRQDATKAGCPGVLSGCK